MAQFEKERFDYHAGVLYYVMARERRFVARFKYAKPLKNKNAFQKFLIANFTIAEYFGKYSEGQTPLSILEEKGFISPNRLEARNWQNIEAMKTAMKGQ